jgi:hypothetical protein
MTMLHQFPESALELIKPKTELEEANNSPESATPSKVVRAVGSGVCRLLSDRRLCCLAGQMEEVEALVDLAFPSPCLPSTRLTFEQFCHWCENTPGVTNVSLHSLCVVQRSTLTLDACSS